MRATFALLWLWTSTAVWASDDEDGDTTAPPTDDEASPQPMDLPSAQPAAEPAAPATLAAWAGARATLGFANPALGNAGGVAVLGGAVFPFWSQRLAAYAALGVERMADTRTGSDASLDLAWTTTVNVLQVPMTAGIVLRAFPGDRHASPELDVSAGWSPTSIHTTTTIGQHAPLSLRSPSQTATVRVAVGVALQRETLAFAPQIGWATSQAESALIGTTSLARLDVSGTVRRVF